MDFTRELIHSFTTLLQFTSAALIPDDFWFAICASLGGTNDVTKLGFVTQAD